MQNFIEKSKELINSLSPLTGDGARLAYRLSGALDRLEAVVSQAEAQFAAGDTHATFNKQTIKAIKSE